MRHNIWRVITFIPMWKRLLYVLIAFGVATLSGALLLPAVWYFEESSRFMESLIIVLSYFREGVIVMFYSLMVIVCLVLIYQYERKRYLQFHIERMTSLVEELHANRDLVEPSVPPELEQLMATVRAISDSAAKAEQELVQADRLKHELVANVAHDLRSPLTSITGYLDLIHSDRYRDEVELRHYIQVIHENATHLKGLINDIFDYTFLQNDRIALQTSEVRLDELLNQLIMQSTLRLSEVEMEARFSSSAKRPIVEGDALKLVRVFENILENAIRYGRDGTYIDTFIEDTDEVVLINMTNYGEEAIPSRDIPYVFERFFRVEKSRAHYTGGSGLGLAIAKSIIDLHEGEIHVTSQPRETTFTIILPKVSSNAVHEKSWLV
ncbi:MULTISPECIES: HAMP domain-containing sensor histidine kinase [unclassified Exiguobacterium]|uniref:sensor histidine kinase n=1 Tax=Exiguobacterium TaxID=33986 RepID=UPI0020375408|nr:MULTISPECIES: HAMP domain-containing sensor histidine kinase [unclassified Exiguobacterium]MCV9899252.1 HAMP domain-containing histidine kinase [Exiguobacterium sp. N5]